jgi:hypothetical protein
MHQEKKDGAEGEKHLYRPTLVEVRYFGNGVAISRRRRVRKSLRVRHIIRRSAALAAREAEAQGMPDQRHFDA